MTVLFSIATPPFPQPEFTGRATHGMRLKESAAVSSFTQTTRFRVLPRSKFRKNKCGVDTGISHCSPALCGVAMPCDDTQTDPFVDDSHACRGV